MQSVGTQLGISSVAAALSLTNALAIGPLGRIPNHTLQLPPAPPIYGYGPTNAFGTLAFTDPVAIVSPPGETNRSFVVEQDGRIAVITNLASPNRTVFLDISSKVHGGVPTDERGLLGMAFHPDYATNGYFYVFYTGPVVTGNSDLNDIVSRYQVSAGNSNQANAASETRLLVQPDDYGNHNGGCLQFGPDGYLYISLGDEGDQNDAGNNSQRIDKDFFSGILRIDVDKRATNLPPTPHVALGGATNYYVPMDNPFVGITTFNGSNINPTALRAEYWAVGLRNPWRFSFDPASGLLYCADVGGGLREEIDIISKGGNYGWAYREGTVNGPKVGQTPPGFASINPITEYGHGSGTNQGFAVTGGVVYRGTRISQLVGAYVFADYQSGNVWLLRYTGSNGVPFQRLFGEAGISAFGIDPRNGDVLMANQSLDRIRRLIYTTNFSGPSLPATLADAGAFTNLTTLAPQPGIVPYDLNVSYWSDNAIKTRWFSIPNTNLDIGFNKEGNWLFPTGTVWVQHFELELTNGVPASRRRLETRFIVKNANGVYGVTYRWGSSATNATLVPEEGTNEGFVVDDGGGILRTQVWHYPSRQECVICHTPAGGFALGFNTPQLNRDFDYGSGPTNQIAALNLAGYFSNNVVEIHTRRSLVSAGNAAASLEYRVRSYLAANCAQCHQPGGSAQSLWDGRIATTLPNAGIINGTLLNNGGNTNNRVIVAGSISNSVLLTRVANPGPGHMPPMDSSVLDTEAINLLSAWITNDLPSYQNFPEWQTNYFGSTNAPDAGADADADDDGAANYLEYLTGTHPLQETDFWKIDIRASGDTVHISFPQHANRGFEVNATPDVLNPPSWSALDVPDNAPFFAASNRTHVVEDAISGVSNQFYRVRVFEP